MDMAQVSPQMSLAEAGMHFAVARRSPLVDAIRLRVRVLAQCREDRTATADDVDIALADLKRTHAELGNAAGSIFRDGCWRFTGDWRASTRDSNHARPVRVWQLK
jgi:hypothetical protein